MNRRSGLGLDYGRDGIHRRYDEGRRLPTETINLWLDAITRHVPIRSVRAIADIGCGTGRFSKVLARAYSAQVLGVDPSARMLASARRTARSRRLRVIQGAAEDIPLPDGSCDMVFLSQVYHHLSSEHRAAEEFKRILSPHGFLCIRNSTTENLGSYLYHDFFPGALRFCRKLLPSRAQVTRTMRNAGFALIARAAVRQVFAENLAEYARKIGLRTCSDLAALPDRQFRAGLRRLEAYCREHDTGEPVREDIDLFVFRRSSRASRCDLGNDIRQ
jgi:ubiquinone/menaquinone biosynthesis C-methylase UbiE